MKWDFRTDSINTLFKNQNTSSNTLQYICVHHKTSDNIYQYIHDMLWCIQLSIHDQYTTTPCSIHLQYISNASYLLKISVWNTSINRCVIHSQYTPDTFEIHSKYKNYVLLWDLTGTFHCCLCPVWPLTAAQYVRSGAWTVGVPSACLAGLAAGAVVALIRCPATAESGNSCRRWWGSRCLNEYIAMQSCKLLCLRNSACNLNPLNPAPNPIEWTTSYTTSYAMLYARTYDMQVRTYDVDYRTCLTYDIDIRCRTCSTYDIVRVLCRTCTTYDIVCNIGIILCRTSDVRHRTSARIQIYIPDTLALHRNTFKIQRKYITLVLLWDLTGTFHCCWCPVWPLTAAQYVRSGAWTVGAASACLPRSGFCCKAPNRACWNVHALPAKKHVWCCLAMAAPTPRSHSSCHTHGLLMPKTGRPDGILSLHMIWDDFIVQVLTKYNLLPSPLPSFTFLQGNILLLGLTLNTR